MMSPTTPTADLLARLLDATPAPPPVGTPMAAILEVAATMIEKREAIWATAAIPYEVTSTAEALQLATLRERGRAWGRLLSENRDQLGAQRMQARKLGAYGTRSR
jgi:hypothetical protein